MDSARSVGRTRTRTRTQLSPRAAEVEDLEQGGLCGKIQNCIDYLITGDFVGLFKSCKRSVRNCIKHYGERYDNFVDWIAKTAKEQEHRANDASMQHPFPTIRMIVNSNAFEFVGNLVIFCNTFVVGWQAEISPKKATQAEQDLSMLFENLFTFAFVFELSLSTMCWGWTYLVKRENWLDVFLVFLGVLTTWILGPFGIQARKGRFCPAETKSRKTQTCEYEIV